MTSEVENVMRAQIVAKTNDLKQIAVSTTNLTPDASGIAPLEKQGAFTPVQTQEPVATAEPVAPVTPDVQPTLAPTEPVAPVIDAQAPIQNNVAPIATNPINEVAAPLENPTVAVQQDIVNPAMNTNDNLESIDYKKPEDSGIITAAPVDVVGATGLDQMNISSFVDKSLEGLNELVKEEPVQEQQVQKMEMPVMDQEIKAQEPIGQDSRLFEGAQVAPDQINQPIPPVGDTPFTVPTIEQNEINNIEPTQVLENPVNFEEAKQEVNPIMESNPLQDINNMIPQQAPEPTVMDTPMEPIQPVNFDNTPASAFDDHLKMPENLTQDFNLPTMDNNVIGNELPPIENTMTPVDDGIPAMDIPPIEAGLPPLENGEVAVDNELPSLDTPVDNLNQEYQNNETVDIESTLEPIFQRFKDELIFSIKSMNSAAMEKQAEPVPESLGNVEFHSTPEATPEMVEPPREEALAAGFNDMNNQFPDMMKIDDEPVHGKFI